MPSTDHVDTRLAQLALERIDGFPFEHFANDFLSALLGPIFVPLGGTKDGGADALEEQIWEGGHQVTTFYQATVEKTVEDKVRRTHKRLLDIDRKPKRIYLVTTQQVRMLDQVEELLSDELGCQITIRDGGYIAAHLNDSPETRATYWQHLHPLTDYLREFVRPTVTPPSSYADKSLVYTFLAQEASRKQAVDSVPAAMVDSLILWALEGTDPDADILRTKEEMLQRIGEEVPGVQNLASSMLQDRLTAMSNKNYPGGRAVRWHRNPDAYCLPHETRRRLESDKLEDETLRLDFRTSLEQRCIESGATPQDLSLTNDIAHAVIRRIYEKEGVEFSAFLADRSPDDEYPTVSHLIRDEMGTRGLRKTQKERMGPLILDALRRVLYSSNETERLYLQRVSKTYSLLFSLASHPEIARYLNDVAAKFYLYVGSDVIIRALSENLLPAESQVTRGALVAAQQAGSTLVLTEPVLDEVLGHLRACDQEHKHNFKVTDVVPREIAREAPHIMLRAYLYARIDGGATAPKSWPGFVHNFIDHEDLYKQQGEDALGGYLSRSFGLTYVSRDDLESLVGEDEVSSLAMHLGATKRRQELADNDALLCRAVYGRRDASQEGVSGSEFGLETWWLTWERSILKLTRDLVQEQGGRYIMRPEFLLRFIALSPDRKKIDDTHQSVFASVLGFTLGRRVSPEAFHELMRRFNEAEQLEPARRAMGVRKLVDKLKSDMSRQYAVEMDGDGDWASAEDPTMTEASLI